ncbi:YoaK family protein [Rhodopseudomonas sp. RCAM05734]|uniref:YoaK family protein n=1 Tax=Rhodopseudomonas sp. RCAM05734 TaxID=3457549 RepID=UPI004044A35F
MKKFGGPATMAALLSFNGGFVDTAGFLGLQGLFVAHVTGNFVTLGAALVHGSHGIIGKVLALPEFVIVIALARLAGMALRAHQQPVLRILLSAKVALLFCFFLLAVGFGPFPDPNTPAALLTGFAGIAAMALQNALQRVHMPALPPSTLMTGSTTQATLDAVDLLTGLAPDQRAAVRARFGKMSKAILYFAAGCALAAILYALVGFWCLALPVLVGLVSATMRIEDPAPVLGA